MNAVSPIYRTRIQHCEECNGAGRARIFEEGDICCPDCDGNASWEAACAECAEVKPLNEDGTCEDCFLMIAGVLPGPLRHLEPQVRAA